VSGEEADAVAHSLLDSLQVGCYVGREEPSRYGPCPEKADALIEWGCEAHGGYRRLAVCSRHRRMIASWCARASQRGEHPLVVHSQEPLTADSAI
jgi:hypothetical protein